MNVDLTIQYNISSLRSALGLSLAKFGSLFGNTSAPAAFNWEHGESIPPRSKLEIFSDFCGISVEEFTSRRLTKLELKVIESLFRYGNGLAYLGSSQIKKVDRNDDKLEFTCEIYFRFSEENLLNSFDLNCNFQFDPSYTSIIVMTFDPVFDSSNDSFLLDFKYLLYRYIHIQNPKHFESILYDAMKFLFGSVNFAVYTELSNKNFPIIGVNVADFDEYKVAFKQHREKNISLPEPNLLINYGQYEHLNNVSLLWPNSFFAKGGLSLFSDYIKTKYN